jgi:hypothetical protein
MFEAVGVREIDFASIRPDDPEAFPAKCIRGGVDLEMMYSNTNFFVLLIVPYKERF